MTRINCVPVQTLTNAHLLAEYKEITRPFGKVAKRLDKGTMGNVKIPPNYVLGEGHETFFFDKLQWLHSRYLDIKKELLLRGFNLDLQKFSDIAKDIHANLSSTRYWKGWQPTPEDMYLNMARLAKRSKLINVTKEINND